MRDGGLLIRKVTTIASCVQSKVMAPELGRLPPVHQLASEAFEYDEAPQVSPAMLKVGQPSRAPV
jgi:hypothetical protein